MFVTLSASFSATALPPKKDGIPSSIEIGADEAGTKYLFGFIKSNLSFNLNSCLPAIPKSIDVIACIPNLLTLISSILSFTASKIALPIAGILDIVFPGSLSPSNFDIGFIFSYFNPPTCLSTCDIGKANPANNVDISVKLPASLKEEGSVIEPSGNPRIESGLYNLVSMVGFNACKTYCFPINPIPCGVSKNFAILNLSAKFLSTKPVNVGAPLTKPPKNPSIPAASCPRNPVSEFEASNPHLPFPGARLPSSSGISLSIKG